MNALILNGSPRREGNTAFVCETLNDLLPQKFEGVTVSVQELQSLNIAPCRACDGCKRNGGICLIKDDGTALAERVAEADILVFATPVYWWGISAQTKLAIDRMYAKGDFLSDKPKMVYVVATGADALDEEQYKLINRQFALICEYLKWDFKGYCAFSALEKNELRNREGVAAQLQQMLDA